MDASQAKNNSHCCRKERRGTLVLHGGAVCDPFFSAAYRAARRKKPRIAVFLSAGPSLQAARQGFFDTYFQRFTSWGFEPVFIPVAVDGYADVPRNRHYVNLVESCHGVFLGGGSQANHARSLLADDGGYTPLAGAIRRLFDRGGVIAGNSAGTHVISDPLYSDGTSYEAMRANGIERKRISDVPASANPTIARNSISLPGLGLISPDVLLCTHHDARGRLGRLIAGVRDLDARYGVGIDEETSLVLAHGAETSCENARLDRMATTGSPTATVAGYCGVFIVEVTPLTVYAPRGEERLFGVSNLRLHYLTEGDRFDFANGRVIPGDDKRPATATPSSAAVLLQGASGASRATQVAQTGDIFGRDGTKYRVTRTIAALVNSAAHSITALATRGREHGGNDPVFEVTFSKDAKTEAYTSDRPYSESRSSGDLEGLRKPAVSSLRVDIGVS